MPTRLASNSEDAVLFKNGDRIRITGTEVVHLRTGRTAVLLTGGVTATGHEALRNVKVTVHLKDLKEKPNELIDLETQATPPIPDSAFRNPRAAASAEEMLAELASMPTGKTTRDENARNLLFVSMDVNANGYLSLVELDGGVKSILPGHAAHAKPAMMQALQAAKVARPESVGRGEEFRVFLLYLRKYLEMLVAFERIDADGDRRLDPEEFSEAVNTGLLAKWGVEVDNPAEAFKEIDQSNEGFISFDEFAHWALHKHLKIEEAQPLARDSEALEKALKAQELAKELAATLEELGSVAEVAKVKKLVNGVVEYHRRRQSARTRQGRGTLQECRRPLAPPAVAAQHLHRRHGAVHVAIVAAAEEARPKGRAALHAPPGTADEGGEGEDAAVRADARPAPAVAADVGQLLASLLHRREGCLRHDVVDQLVRGWGQMVAAAAAGSGARVAAEAEGGAETAGRAARHAVAPTIANAAGERAAGGCVAAHDGPRPMSAR